MNKPDTSKDPIAQAFQSQSSPPPSSAKRRAIQAAMAAFREEQAQTSSSKETHIEQNIPLAQKKVGTAQKKLSKNYFLLLQGFSNSLRLKFECFIKPIGDWIMNKQILVGGGLASACAIVVSILLFAPEQSTQTNAPTAPVLADITIPKEPKEPALKKTPLSEAIKETQGISEQRDSADASQKLVHESSANSSKMDQAVIEPTKEKIATAAPTATVAPATKEVQKDLISQAEKRQLKKENDVRRLIRTQPEPEMAITTAITKPSGLTSGSVESHEMMGFTANKSMAISKIGIQPPDILPPQDYAEKGEDEFTKINTNPVKLVSEEPISTFSADVDTASYSFTRRQLTRGVMPQKDAVRVEEIINYFNYSYPLPTSKSQPFKPTIAVTDSPWKDGNKLIHIGIKGYDVKPETPPKANIVFLLDVSGSMRAADKLPLVKQSMELLLSKLNPEDTVAIVVYAGQSGTALEPTPVKEKQKIIDAMNQLNAGGGTAGAEGIKRAYELAEANFVKEGINRIFLATDGDFNLGIRNHEELKGFVERKREKGIFLSVLGFGQGNYHDNLMQALAQNGNGIAAYIDTLGEAQKVLVEEASSSLFPIAKDVKLQVEFNPTTVKEYRLIGYETRALKREDFNNDAVDAGDIGSGHTVTAIYEITPTGSSSGLIEPKRYGNASQPSAPKNKDSEYGFLKIRYKQPEQSQSNLIEAPILIKGDALSSELQKDIDFATAVAGFSQLLRDGKYTGSWDYDDAIQLAHKNKGEDFYGYRTEFVQLIRKAKVAKSL